MRRMRLARLTRSLTCLTSLARAVETQPPHVGGSKPTRPRRVGFVPSGSPPEVGWPRIDGDVMGCAWPVTRPGRRRCGGRCRFRPLHRGGRIGNVSRWRARGGRGGAENGGAWDSGRRGFANQITQISNQVSQIRSMARQLSELEDQLDHIERAARGEIDALLAPFSRLAAEPVGLVRNGLAWGSDFQGAARETVDAVRDMGSGGRSFTGLWRTAQSAADRVSEADILALFGDHPLDAAAALAETIRERAGLVRRPHRERQPIKSARKSLCPLAHWLTGFRYAPRVAPNVQLTPTPPSATPRCPSGRGRRAAEPRRRGWRRANRVLAFMSDYDGTQGPEDSGIHQ